MIMVYIALAGILLIVFMVLIRQTPASKQKGDKILLPLMHLLENPVKSGIVWSFDYSSKIEGQYQNRHLAAQVGFGRQGYSGNVSLVMRGLDRFPKQPLILSEYPKVIGDVIHQGNVVSLELPLSKLDKALFLAALNDLTASCKKLESEAASE